MNEQVLSIEQMREIIELGIDTSKASAFYYPNYGEYYEHPITKKYVHDIKSYNPYPSFVNGDRTLKDLNPDLFPAFSLQDILEMLPDIGKEYANHPHLFKASDGINWYCSYGTMTCEIKGETPLDAAFKMLKWCKENKHI